MIRPGRDLKNTLLWAVNYMRPRPQGPNLGKPITSLKPFRLEDHAEEIAVAEIMSRMYAEYDLRVLDALVDLYGPGYHGQQIATVQDEIIAEIVVCPLGDDCLGHGPTCLAASAVLV